MSYTSTSSTVPANNAAILQHALSNLNVSNTNGNYLNGLTMGSTTVVPVNSNNIYKISPTFKMELFKSENGGFVMNLINWDASTHTEKTKLFILNDVENMGRDIQNILVMEILKT